MMKLKKISIKKIAKKKNLESTRLSRQIYNMGHKIEITIKNSNHNKL